ncbi:MAG: hypothetical protein AAGE52_35390 [Myxococcota bacterium]
MTLRTLALVVLAAACGDAGSDAATDARTGADASTDSAIPSDSAIEPRDGGGMADHSYFEMLAAHPNAHYSLRIRSNEDIWPLHWSRPERYDAEELFYDSELEAAANFFDVGDGSSGTSWGPGRDGRNQFEAISGTTAFFYWEARWSDRFTAKDDNNRIGGELETHKAFILLGSLIDDRPVEIRSRFNQASAEEGVARTDIRQYGSAAGVSPNGETEGGDSVAVRSDDFVVQANTWTYHWVYLDMNEGNLSYWIQDERQALAVIYDDVPVVVEPDLTLVGFEFRHNSSQSGGTAPEGFTWNRNLAVLTGVTLAEARALVSLR